MRKSFALGKVVFGMLVAGLITAQAAVISGKISIGTSTTGLVGAIVTFQTFNGGGATYADTSIDGGLYTLPTIPDGSIGLFSVTATGYTPVSEILQAAIVTGVVTKNVAMTLVGQPTAADSGIIRGTITDSVSLAAVDGAQIILISRTGGSTGTPMDTILSANGGKYLFDSLPMSGYTLAVTKTGYLPYASATVTLRANTSKDTVNIRLVSIGNKVGTVAGKVTSSATGNPAVSGAKIILSRTTSPTGPVLIVDSAVTNTTGDYTIANVPAASGYTAVVSKTGFTSANVASFVVDSGVVATKNVQLAVIVLPACVVKGTVTDSASLNAIANAKVVLRKRGTTFQWQAVDSMNTLQNGTFRFASLDIGTYSIVVSEANHKTYTTPNNANIAFATNPDSITVAVVLAPIAKGSLVVYVSSAGAPVSGASVSAIEKLTGNLTGATYSGATAANGYISFADIVTGSYDVTVSKTGLTTAIQNKIIGTPGPDTLRVTLVAATGTSKMVKGAVVSGTNAVLAGTVVVLSATATAQPTLTLTDTADANGLYAISGIPTVYTRVTLAFSKTGYTTKDTANVRLSTTSDTTTINIVLVQPTSVVSNFAHFGLAGISLIRGEKGGILRFGTNLQNARVSMIDLNGRIVMTREILAGAHEIALPASLSGKRTIVRIEQGAQVIQKSVVLP